MRRGEQRTFSTSSALTREFWHAYFLVSALCLRVELSPPREGFRIIWTFKRGRAYELRLVRVDQYANLTTPAAGSFPVAPVSVSRALPCLPSTQLCEPLLRSAASKCRQHPPGCGGPRRSAPDAAGIGASAVCEMQLVLIDELANLAFSAFGSSPIAPASISRTLPRLP